MAVSWTIFGLVDLHIQMQKIAVEVKGVLDLFI